MNSVKPIIAVVENDPAMLKAVERLLRANNYPAEVFASAEQFLARDGFPSEVDCLILDINLDGMSGIDLQEKLLVQGFAPPIIFITGQNDQMTHAIALILGCVDYLKKPFQSHALISAVEKALSIH